MDVRAVAGSTPRLSGARVRWLLLVGLALIAYRGLGAAPISSHLEDWVFRPGAMPSWMAAVVALGLLWRKRAALRALPGPGSVPLGIAFAALGTGLFVWAQLTGAAHLLLPSLAANGLAIAAATRGGVACRIVSVPSCVLLLGLPIPKPLVDEILWQLQLATARGAGWLLDAIGHEIFQNGVILRDSVRSFHVIDGCSGLNGIVILTLIALIVRDLFDASGWKSWLGVLAAAPLGFLLNVVRIAYVAASPDPEALAGATGDHTPQGIAVLMTGTAILYAVGWVLSGRSGRMPSPTAVEASAGDAGWRFAWVGLAALAVASFSLPRFDAAQADAPRVVIGLPTEKGNWTSEHEPGDRLFNGQLSGGQHRRYRREIDPARPPDFVDLLVGFEHESTGETFRMLSSKLAYPGSGWSLVERRPERIWVLSRDAELAIATAGAGSGAVHAVVYAWKKRDLGLWRESWRALLALDKSPWRRERPRAAIRLVSRAPHDGQLELDWAKQRIDLFIKEFREELDAL
jgi:exosortase